MYDMCTWYVSPRQPTKVVVVVVESIVMTSVPVWPANFQMSESSSSTGNKAKVSFSIRMLRGGMNSYELVHCSGNVRRWEDAIKNPNQVRSGVRKFSRDCFKKFSYNHNF